MKNNRAQVKICGIARTADAEKCAELGADMIGLNFYAQSPRYVKPALARQIVEAVPPSVCAVGVFVEPSNDEVHEVAALVGLRCIQIHGNISREMCRKFSSEFRVIRALRTDKSFRPEDAQLAAGCDVLIDAYHPELPGGTGQICDWSMARATLPFARFLILSGGLNAKNVREAITAVAPHAVDVCSGIESTPGVKDHRAIEEFIAAVRG